MNIFSGYIPDFPLKTVVKDLFLFPRRMVFFGALSVFLTSCSAPGVNHGNRNDWSQTKIEQLLDAAGRIPEPGQRITFISAAFLGTAYLADTLIGSIERPEEFVLRLDGVDCLTLLDYVEALRRSATFDDFKETLRRIRYQGGHVNFLNRNHFFSEWGHGDFAQLRDVTALVAGENIHRVEKQLNQKADGSLYLPGYPVKKRELTFIPPEAFNRAVLDRLHSGDYVGIYSPDPGLDVSHSGIVIKQTGKVFLRHASSSRPLAQVVDEELLSYLSGKKGLIIYRPIDAN
jgi:hypothetical protein